MCGEIRKSPDAKTAVRWAIAYAKSFEAGDDYQREGEPLPDSSLRRTIAQEFITEYVPATQREAARGLLEAAPDPLDTAVRYWSTVVDQRMSFSDIMAIVGTKVHDTFDSYKDRAAVTGGEPLFDTSDVTSD